MRKYSLSLELGQVLKHKQWVLSTAESCTGGGIAEAVTDISGSSAWFDAGFITYSNEAKQRMLDVTPQSLNQHGAVSQAVVEEMVLGAIQHSRANIAVSVSGVAGPNGGSEEKPVGTVWIGWAVNSEAYNDVRSECFVFKGDRQAVRMQAVEKALEGLLVIAQGD